MNSNTVHLYKTYLPVIHVIQVYFTQTKKHDRITVIHLNMKKGTSVYVNVMSDSIWVSQTFKIQPLFEYISVLKIMCYVSYVQ